MRKDREKADDFRVAVLTSTDIRHRYFASILARRFHVAVVGYQDIAYDPSDRARYEIDDKTAALLRRHFDDRTLAEQNYFSQDAAPIKAGNDTVVLHLDPTSLNSASTVKRLQGAGVSAVAVFGTSLIKAPLLDAYAGRLINMHLGLSPYYRGTATNFYPLVNGEPEYVGATIHLIDAGIDSGPILHHARAEIAADDMPHTLGCKTILAGIEKMIVALDEFRENRLRPVPQWPVSDAKFYLRKHYHPSQVVTVYDRIERGMFTDYGTRHAAVNADLQLVP